ncbi:MAG: agmatinase [Halobacteria archaeon]|nr:agmatinase [Halobacteria archaeon]
MTFADADDEYDESEFVIAGVPLEATVSFRRGTAFGPRRIREASYGFEPYLPRHGVGLDEIGVHDYGDLDVWNSPEEVVGFSADVIEGFVNDGKTPVLIGGEHTVSLAGVRATQPDVFVSIDAHLDLKDEFEGSRYSHACVTRRTLEEGIDAVVVGARAGSRQEYRRADADDVTVVTADGFSVESVEEALEGYDRPYISVDLDAVDPGYAPGVGTPEPYGLEPREVRDVVEHVASDAVGFDVVEACPSHGSGEASLLGAKLLRGFVGASV